MKHAGKGALRALSRLRRTLARSPGVVEKKPGIFHRRSKPLLHFHEDDGRLYADLRAGAEWKRFPVNSIEEQRALLSAVNPPWIGAVLVRSLEPAKLAAFYREAVGLPLVQERHGDDHVEYGCELRECHFAIHPAGARHRPGEGGYRVAFAVEDVDAVIARLKAAGAKIEIEPQDLSFGRLAGFRDPEGNWVEIITLSESWLSHLDKGR